MNQCILVYVVLFSRPSLPCFPHHVYSSSRVSCTYLSLLHSPRPCPSPSVPGPWSFARCNDLAGASGLSTVIAGYSLVSPPLLRLPTDLYFNFKASQALYPLHLCVYTRPRPRSRSHSHSFLRAHRCTSPRSRPRPRLRSRHRFLVFIPDALFFPRHDIVGQAPDLAPEAAGYL